MRLNDPEKLLDILIKLFNLVALYFPNVELGPVHRQMWKGPSAYFWPSTLCPTSRI